MSSYTYLKEIQLKYKLKRVKNDNKIGEMADAKTVFNIFQDLHDEAKEKLFIICVDENQKIICFELIAIGSDSEMYISSKEIFKTAILINAYGFILVHNHPFNGVTPSQDDKNFTKKVIDMSNIMEIKILDHIIIASNKYFSFKENKLI